MVQSRATSISDIHAESSRRNIGGEYLADAGAHRLALGVAQAGERMRLVGDAGRALEHDEPPAEAQRLLDRMGDENPGRAGLAQQLAELVAQRIAGVLVERAERLVAQQNVRLAREGARDR